MCITSSQVTWLLSWRYEWKTGHVLGPRDEQQTSKQDEEDATVKASNFAPHGNFGPILARSVAAFDEFCTKHEQKKVHKSIVFLQLLFRSFSCKSRFEDPF